MESKSDSLESSPHPESLVRANSGLIGAWPSGASANLLQLGLFLDQFTAASPEKVFNKVGGVNTAAKLRVLQDSSLKRNGGFDSFDDVLL